MFAIDALDKLVKANPLLKSMRIAHIGEQVLRLDSLTRMNSHGWIDSSTVQAWAELLALHDATITTTKPTLAHRPWIMDSFFYDRLTGVLRNPDGSEISSSGLRRGT